VEERLVHTEEVGGSSPPSPTILYVVLSCFAYHYMLWLRSGERNL
jgi:hypothetical protein